MNRYIVKNNTLYIQLQNGHEAIIDYDDLALVNKYHWYAHKNGNTIYVRTTKNNKKVLLHRLLMQPSKKQVVDHINGNGLDNRRANLRNVTNQQNTFNASKRTCTSSKYKGVHFEKSRGKWKAQIGFNGQRIYIGRFDSEEKAALAYNKKAIELFGVEYARLNSLSKETVAA